MSDGADLTVEGSTCTGHRFTALQAAVVSTSSGGYDVVAYLISRGGNANANDVMYYGVQYGDYEILQLLINGGGDINRTSGGELPLFTAIRLGTSLSTGTAGTTAGTGTASTSGYRMSEDVGQKQVAVLLSQPELNLLLTDAAGKTAEQLATTLGKRNVAALIRAEVLLVLP